MRQNSSYISVKKFVLAIQSFNIMLANLRTNSNIYLFLLNFSQSALANWLNVSLNAVQAWEQGLRNPSQAVLRLLDIFDKDFSSIEAIYAQN